MEILSKDQVAAVTLINVKVSEDELALYEAVLSYVLDSLNSEELELRFGASVDEIEGIRDDLREALGDHVIADSEALLAQAERD
jgi:hypothetical protein